MFALYITVLSKWLEIILYFIMLFIYLLFSLEKHGVQEIDIFVLSFSFFLNICISCLLL